ncbi:Insect cuticle protein [Trinorchestia longiramus]|nr:Insect cuticle protein [Trinorchestia longiramus]
MWKLNVLILLLCPLWAVAGSSPTQRIGFTLENQFRKEVNDGEGGVLGEYGMRTGDGCLRVTKFKATPAGGFRVLSTHKEDCDPIKHVGAFERTKKPLPPKPKKEIREPAKMFQQTEAVLPVKIPSLPSSPPIQSPSPPSNSPTNKLPSPPPILKPSLPPSENRPLVQDTPAAIEPPQSFQSVPEDVNLIPDVVPSPETAVHDSRKSNDQPPETPRPSIEIAPAKSPKPKTVPSPDRGENRPKQLKKEFDYDSLSGDARARILDEKDDPVYSFGFTAPGHGHTQAGLSDGTKKGEYYFDSLDGWRRIVSYEANENGFFPKMRRIRIPGWIPPPPPPRRVRNRGPSKGREDDDRPEGGDGKGINRSGPDSGPDGKPNGRQDGGTDGEPDGGPNGGPDGRPDGRPDGGLNGGSDGGLGNSPDGEFDGKLPDEQIDNDAETDPEKSGLNNGDPNRDRDTGKQLLKELKQKGGVGSCPYYFFYSTKVNFHWERCMENGTKVGQYGKLHEDGYSYRTSYYADSTGYHPTSTKAFLTDQQRALVHDFVRGVFIIPQVDEERKRTEQRILQWLEENSELLTDPLRELAAR